MMFIDVFHSVDFEDFVLPRIGGLRDKFVPHKAPKSIA